VVRSAGDWQACASGTAEAPHPNCGSPIQMFLAPIPGRGAEEGPPGTVKVDLVSANASARWDVYVDDQVICTTPCGKWLHPDRPIFLRTRDDGFLRMPDRIQLTSLAPYREAVQVQAHATNQGKLATGIVFTSFGGMGVMTGLMLGLLGCSGERAGLCTGGLITGAAGGLLAAGSIFLILDAMPRAEIIPAAGSSMPYVAVGLGGARGRF
jgi:hypothetical protein